MTSIPHEAHASTPPVLPPKPGSNEASAIHTPASYGHEGPPPPSIPGQATSAMMTRVPEPEQDPALQDPGENWLPAMLQDKSKQDLAEILSSPALLHALTHAHTTAPPSLSQSHSHLQTSLSANSQLSDHLSHLATDLSHLRAQTQSQLLATHTLERQWRAKQTSMDHALAPFSPASLYQQLGQGLLEQEGVCQALEESFLEEGRDGDGGGAGAEEREVGEWVKRYREARTQFYLRQERKQRWDEGRVGGWR